MLNTIGANYNINLNRQSKIFYLSLTLSLLELDFLMIR